MQPFQLYQENNDAFIIQNEISTNFKCSKVHQLSISIYNLCLFSHRNIICGFMFISLVKSKPWFYKVFIVEQELANNLAILLILNGNYDDEV